MGRGNRICKLKTRPRKKMTKKRYCKTKHARGVLGSYALEEVFRRTAEMETTEVLIGGRVGEWG